MGHDCSTRGATECRLGGRVERVEGLRLEIRRGSGRAGVVAAADRPDQPELGVAVILIDHDPHAGGVVLQQRAHASSSGSRVSPAEISRTGATLQPAGTGNPSAGSWTMRLPFITTA